MVITGKISYLLCALRTILKRMPWLLISILIGCGPRTEQPPSQQKSFIAVWCSQVASPEEQVKAVNKLIAPGTKGAVAERLLGAGGVWVHSHGQYVGYLR